MNTLTSKYYDVSYRQAHAAVSMIKAAGDSEISYDMHGRLYVSSANWAMLSVPNALVRGAFDALGEPGLELPSFKDSGRLNAHISVMRPEEIEQIGGADKVTERGHTFRYRITGLETVEPAGWKEMSRVWMLRVSSPELKKLRGSYGLSPDPKYPFHITVACRRRKVFQDNEVKKVAEAYNQSSLLDYLVRSPLYLSASRFVEFQQDPGDEFVLPPLNNPR